MFPSISLYSESKASPTIVFAKPPILRKFVEERPEFDSYEIKEYIDDGFSGKNFERPGIQELLEDVRSGKVFGIIVKDFSRFGRNHIEVGNYIEKIFPLLDVRFIAVNNSFDSKDYLGTTPDMDVAFENLIIRLPIKSFLILTEFSSLK